MVITSDGEMEQYRLFKSFPPSPMFTEGCKCVQETELVCLIEIF